MIIKGDDDIYMMKIIEHKCIKNLLMKVERRSRSDLREEGLMMERALLPGEDSSSSGRTPPHQSTVRKIKPLNETMVA